MGKSSWKTQYVNIASSSSYHKAVRQIFVTDSFFSVLNCYQEVPVAELICGYPNNSHRFDWYIEELNTVVELHGEQHYNIVNFGNEPWIDAANAFKKNKAYDMQKKQAAINADIKYVEIDYKKLKKITPEILKKEIL